MKRRHGVSEKKLAKCRFWESGKTEIVRSVNNFGGLLEHRSIAEYSARVKRRQFVLNRVGSGEGWGVVIRIGFIYAQMMDSLFAAFFSRNLLTVALGGHKREGGDVAVGRVYGRRGYAFRSGLSSERLNLGQHRPGFLFSEPSGVFTAAFCHEAIAEVGLGCEDVGGLVGDDGPFRNPACGRRIVERAETYIALLSSAGVCWGFR